MIEDPNEQEQLRLAHAQKDMEQRYRNVFGTTEGRRVLGDILQMCHFGFGITSEQARHEYNIGIAIARMSGIMGSICKQLGIEEE